ncbi:AfsR/SARP family transcriptional regulator [Luedemannella helvata]
MEIELEVLGPVQVRRDGARVRLGPRLVALLSVLVVELGRAVPANRLVDMVWSGGAPDAAPATLRSHVSHLRRALRGAHGTAPLTTLGNGHGVGYRLDVRAEQVDARRFELTYAQARPLLTGTAGDRERAVRLLRDALEMWRGPAFADVADRPFALPEIARLGALRRAVRRTLAEALSTLGRHGEAVGELAGHVAEDPYDEGLRRQLAVALYAEHRTDEAAQVCRDGLRLLRERGIEAPDLHSLQLTILRRELAVPR